MDNNYLIESCIKSLNEQISLISKLSLSENSDMINKLSSKILNLLENEIVNNENDKILEQQQQDSCTSELSFWKVYRNIFVQQQIFKQIRLLNNHYHQRYVRISENDLLNNFNGIEEINNYQYKDYFNNIDVRLDQSITLKKISQKSIIQTLYKLPKNITTVNLDIYLYKRDENGVTQGDEFEKIDEIDEITQPIVPSSITNLKLHDTFNYSFGPSVIPSTLKSLTFGRKWNHPLEIKTYSKSGQVTMRESIFPTSGLTSLKFGLYFRQNIFKSTLPQSLTKLEFDGFSSILIEAGSIPNSVTHLTFNGAIDLVQGLLPVNLEYFRCDKSNVPIEPGVLPKGLKHLIFSIFSTYNFEILENSFPMGLETIQFGEYFNQSLENLPTSIKSLKLGAHFEHISSIYHLASLVNLQLDNEDLIFEPYWYLSPVERYGLLSLEKFIFHYNSTFINSNSIPPNIKYIGQCTNDKKFQITSEFENIKSMCMAKYDTVGFILKPNQLSKHLEFIDNLDNSEPIGSDILSHMTNLKKVKLSYNFNHCLLPNTFPSSLTELYIPSSYSFPLAKDVLPVNLKYLSAKGIESLSDVHFPDSLKILELGFEFNKEISAELLPPNIETLIIWGFKTTFKLPLPTSLVSIFISHTNSSILYENNLEFFKQHCLIIKVLPTSLMDNAFKNKW